MEQRIDFERNVVSWNAKSSTRGQMMKFHRGQKWLSSRSTDLEISLLPCISLLSDGEPIELDRLLDREGGSSPKLGMSLPPSRPCKLGQLSSFSSLSPLIEFHDISTNFPGVYRGICEAKIVETVWKWPSISPLATRNIVTGGGRATKILSLVNSSTSTLYISCSLERIGSETVWIVLDFCVYTFVYCRYGSILF